MKDEFEEQESFGEVENEVEELSLDEPLDLDIAEDDEGDETPSVQPAEQTASIPAPQAQPNRLQEAFARLNIDPDQFAEEFERQVEAQRQAPAQADPDAELRTLVDADPNLAQIAEYLDQADNGQIVLTEAERLALTTQAQSRYDLLRFQVDTNRDRQRLQQSQARSEMLTEARELARDPIYSPFVSDRNRLNALADEAIRRNLSLQEVIAIKHHKEMAQKSRLQGQKTRQVNVRASLNPGGDPSQLSGEIKVPRSVVNRGAAAIWNHINARRGR